LVVVTLIGVDIVGKKVRLVGLAIRAETVAGIIVVVDNEFLLFTFEFRQDPN
jgi:hypothetical protein